MAIRSIKCDDLETQEAWKKNAGQNPFEGHTESKHQDF